MNSSGIASVVQGSFETVERLFEFDIYISTAYKYYITSSVTVTDIAGRTVTLLGVSFL